MVTEQEQPVEFFLTPGSYSDTSACRLYGFDLPAQALITPGKACNDYDVEDAINEAGLCMKPIRKKNSKRPVEPWVFYVQSTYCKIVGTTGSKRSIMLLKPIHSVTAQGFECPNAFIIYCKPSNPSTMKIKA